MNLSNKHFWIHDQAGKFIRMVIGYEYALKTIKQYSWDALLITYSIDNKVVIVYAHVPEKQNTSWMSTQMIENNIKPNTEILYGVQRGDNE